jgi:hypothetical protein
MVRLPSCCTRWLLLGILRNKVAAQPVTYLTDAQRLPSKAPLSVLFRDQRLLLPLVPPHNPHQCLLSSAQHDSASQRRWPLLMYSFSPGQMWTGVRVIWTMFQAAYFTLKRTQSIACLRVSILLTNTASML